VGKLVVLIALMFLMANCLVVAGIYMLVGAAWAMIAAGLSFAIGALVLRKGLTNG
jgi:hypothetical protein